MMQISTCCTGQLDLRTSSVDRDQSTRIAAGPLRSYRRSHLRGDLFAGLTVAALVIPLGLAFAEVAGLPPVYGLYTSIIPVIVFGIVASTPQAVVGAEAALSGIVAAAIAPAVAAGHDPVHAAGALTIMIGVVSLIGAALKLGRLAQIISRPVFIGYLAGVAVSVSAGQIPRLIGAPSIDADTLLGIVRALPAAFGAANGYAVAIGCGVAVVVLAGRILAPRIPTALVALVVATACSALLDLRDVGVSVVGALPHGLPDLVVPRIDGSDLVGLTTSAAAIALVGFADTTVVSQGFAARNGYRVNSTRDLAALGAADLASGAFGGLPVSASSARTAVAEASGGRTQAAPMLSAVLIMVMLLGAADLVRWVPQPALAGIIVAVMIGLIDVRAVAALARSHRSELVVCGSAFVGVAIVGVLQGVAIAIAISVAATVLREAHPHGAVVGRRAESGELVPVDEAEHVEPIDGTVIYRFDAPLFFGNVDALCSRLWAAVEAAQAAGQDVRYVVISAAAITDIDYTACRELEELDAAMASHGITLVLAGLNHEVISLLQVDGLLQRFGDRATCPNVGAALALQLASVDHAAE